MTDKGKDRLYLSVVFTIFVAGYITYWLPSCAGGNRWKLSRTIQSGRGILSNLEAYRQKFGNYPAGDSEAIMRALNGNNPVHWHAPPPPIASTNQAGIWLDEWGKAYEVRTDPLLVKSAGPNGKFGDKDDIVVDWKMLTASNKIP